MKKTLVLAMTMVLGVSAYAFAANPFSDVPEGHWAYNSVSKLAATGVIDGYPGGQYEGNQKMTRYEMAQIVAKAMSKGANVDKLAAEFADELDALGVRVNRLEKNSDAVKISGQVRYSYADYSGEIKGYGNNLRTRLWFNGQVNDDWQFTAMLQNMQNFGNDEGDEKTDFQRVYVDGKLGGVQVRGGRLPLYLVNGNLYDTRADGIMVTYGDDIKVTGFYIKPTDQVRDFAKFANEDSITAEYGKAFGAIVDAQIGVFNASVGYTAFNDGDAFYNQGWNGKAFSDTTEFEIKNNKIWNVGMNVDVIKDLNFSVDYLKSNFNGFIGENGKHYKMDDDGLVFGFGYKGAKASEPGSYGLYTKHYNQGRGTVVAHTMNGDYGTTGFKGYMVGANYALAKNMVGAIEWYDLESKAVGNDIGSKDMRTLWSQLMITF